MEKRLLVDGMNVITNTNNMKFHFYRQPNLVKLPKSTIIQDLRSLVYFNKIIKNRIKMDKIENKEYESKD